MTDRPGGPPDPADTSRQTSLPFSPDSRSPDPTSPGVRLHVDQEGLGWILFDLPRDKVNKLNSSLMEALRGLLDEAVRKNVTGLVFASDKPDMFMAGADVEEIAGITDAREAMEKAAHGQAIFEAIARFSKPTVAVIAGPCLGGGYELALACTYRVAENKPSVKIGLPEVKLGIIPGFGGTQRLPRRVGIPTALDLILAGKTLPARQAMKRGMVDALVPPGEGRRVAREILTGNRIVVPRRPGRLDRALLVLPFFRSLIFKKAGQALARRVSRDHYPAPFMALESIASGLSKREVAAYRNEARLLGEALVTETSKNLVWLFHASGEAKEPKGLDLSTARPVKRLGVVGAGIMGGGIAWLAGDTGFPIRVKDIETEALGRAMETAGTIWSNQVRRRRLTPAEQNRRLGHLSFTLDYSGFNRVDLAIEAVVERMEIKRKVIAELESVLAEDAVIASNTSSLRIEDIALGARRPDRIVGLHFFNPVNRMPLVEVVAAPSSSDASVAAAYKLALAMGKTPILVTDGPGFLVNRLLTFYLGEALHLFETGIDPVRVDRFLTDFGMPMGPFELLDQIGLDVGEKVTQVMTDAFGSRLPPQAALGRLVSEGHLGRKTGLGFYVYEHGKKQGPSPEALRAAGSPPRWEPPRNDVLDRLMLPMINEAARCLDEGVVHRPVDVDLGMVMGTGFPPFRGGLLRYADQRGVKAVADRLDVLAGSVSPRFAPSEALRRRTAGFYVY